MEKRTPDRDHGAQGEFSPAELAELDRPLFESLGIDKGYAPEETAPPIDREQLIRFIRRTLAQQEREAVIRLIARYRSWHDAWATLMHEQPS